MSQLVQSYGINIYLCKFTCVFFFSWTTVLISEFVYLQIIMAFVLFVYRLVGHVTADLVID